MVNDDLTLARVLLDGFIRDNQQKYLDDEREARRALVRLLRPRVNVKPRHKHGDGQSVDAIGCRPHSWPHVDSASCRDNTRPISGFADSKGA